MANSLDEHTSKPPYKQMRVNCPVCNYNNPMGVNHKEGEKVLCGSCGHWFHIGSK